MKWEFRKTDDYGELIFSGEITVQCISELLPVLSRSLDKVQRDDAVGPLNVKYC